MSLAIVLIGSSGSGLLSAGDIVMEGLMHAGYHVVADREYPSLIKGGCSMYRIEVSDTPVKNISEFPAIMVSFDRVGSKNAINVIAENGLLIYGDERHEQVPGFNQQLKTKNLTTIFIPEYATPKKFGANELLSNMLMIGALWQVLGLSDEGLIKAVEKRFASKPTLLALDIALIRHGYLLNDAVIQKEEIKNNKEEREGSIKKIESDSLPPEKGGEGAEGTSGGFVTEEVNGKEQGDYEKSQMFINFNLPSRVRADPALAGQPLQSKLLDGNEILALSAVHHGVRAYFAYPMSPSSTILTHLANWAEKTGMHVEQVEDEISVSQMALGASFGGTRSLCATSGGGFDLMTETVSLAGMIETPLTIIVAQRPGPATGLPTWSAQEDLNLAIYSGHGEYAKAVIAVGDHADAFTVLGEALNLAETYQMPVIVLTDKTLAETNATVNLSSLVGVDIERGITESAQCIEKVHTMDSENKKTDSDVCTMHGNSALTPSSRYGLTESGISPRWLPNEGPRYYANGDEHRPDGTLTEDVAGVMEAHEKRLRKMKTLESVTPEPVLFGNPDAKITLVGYGSTKMEIMDFVQKKKEERIKNKDRFIKNSETCPLDKGGQGGFSEKVNYLHYTHIWPLKTDALKKLKSRGNHLIIVEHNMTGQFRNLLQQAGVKTHESWLKYDGRRFYREEVEKKINALSSSFKLKVLFWWRKVFG